MKTKRLPKRYAVPYSPRAGHRSLADFDSATEAVSFAVEHGSDTLLDRKTNERVHIAGMRKNPTKASKRRPKTFERCVQDVKRSNRKKSGNPLKPYNPWAICNASVRGLRAKPKRGARTRTRARQNPVITYDLLPLEAKEWKDSDSFRKGVMATVDTIHRASQAPVLVASAGKVLATRTSRLGWQFN